MYRFLFSLNKIVILQHVLENITFYLKKTNFKMLPEFFFFDVLISVKYFLFIGRFSFFKLNEMHLFQYSLLIVSVHTIKRQILAFQFIK